MTFRPCPKPEPKKKHCSKCNNPIFSKGLCLSHWKSMYAAKKLKEIKPKTELLEKWYLALHEKHKYTSAETGNTLAYDKKQACHLLPKSKYEYFKTDLENGMLLEWRFHHILDFGSAAQRKALKCWDEIVKKRKKLLESVGLEYSEDYWLNIKL